MCLHEGVDSDGVEEVEFGPDDELKEGDVVPTADAVIYPLTMMIKVIHTSSAVVAVLRCYIHINLTELAKEV